MIFYTQNKRSFMIDFNYIDIDEFNAKYKVASPEQSQIKDFGINCENLIKCTKTDNEEFQKNEINNMLKACFGYECNVKDKIDSCIYDEDIPKVLIEVKQLSNKTEFPKTKDNPLSKAFVQSVFYFLKEHLDNNNNEIKHIIICNPISFFIFDANEFIIFKNDSTIKKLYKNTTDGTDKSREKFYKDLISYLSSEFNKSIKYTHFELNDKTIDDDSMLSKIYQLLSLQVLLKQKRYIDSNTLNEDFYNELLHILGLKQTNKNGVFVIDLSDEANTLSDLITQNLKLDKLKDFESIFSLITTWNNRILFLRLLESMLKEGASAKGALTWLTTELLGRLKGENTLQTCGVDSKTLAILVKRIEEGKISGKSGKEILDVLMEKGGDVDNLIDSMGLAQINDDGAIIAVIESVLSANADKVAEYKSGKDKLFGFFVGQVMKNSKGANPARVNELLKEKLG